MAVKVAFCPKSKEKKLIICYIKPVLGHCYSESESALFAKCAQAHKEFVVVFKKLLVHTHCKKKIRKKRRTCWQKITRSFSV